MYIPEKINSLFGRAALLAICIHKFYHSICRHASLYLLNYQNQLIMN